MTHFVSELCEVWNYVPCDQNGDLEIKSTYLTDLDFADDIAPASENNTNAQFLLQKPESAAAAVRLTINQLKTEATIIGDEPNISHSQQETPRR